MAGGSKEARRVAEHAGDHFDRTTGVCGEGTCRGVVRNCRALLRFRATGAVATCTWLYLLFVAAVWLLIGLAGDRWWLATMMLFGPRWVYGAPPLLLVPAAIGCRRRSLWPLAAAALIVVWPIMGLCLPVARLWPGSGPSIRVLTCNVKGHCHRNRALEALIRDAAVNVVALQGCWGEVAIDWPAG